MGAFVGTTQHTTTLSRSPAILQKIFRDVGGNDVIKLFIDHKIHQGVLGDLKVTPDLEHFQPPRVNELVNGIFAAMQGLCHVLYPHNVGPIFEIIDRCSVDPSILLSQVI